MNPAVVHIDQLGRRSELLIESASQPKFWRERCAPGKVCDPGRELLEHEGFEKAEEGLISTGS